MKLPLPLFPLLLPFLIYFPRECMSGRIYMGKQLRPAGECLIANIAILEQQNYQLNQE